MKSQSQGIPLACNMNVFTPAQHEAHIATTNQLFQTVQAIREVENGIEFGFPHLTSVSKLGEFIANEKLCCPFLDFTLKVPSGGAPITLLFTGPEGTQEFLRAEFTALDNYAALRGEAFA